MNERDLKMTCKEIKRFDFSYSVANRRIRSDNVIR